MTKPVADAADVAPRKSGTENFCLITKPDGGFTDHLKFAFDGGDGFRIVAESPSVHALRKLLDVSDSIGDVMQGE